MRFDHVLLLGFGAPEKIDDIDLFLSNVTRGRNIPAERLASVKHHYELIGGGSPYNRRTMELAASLEQALSDFKLRLPVFAGMRNWHPYVHETLREIRVKGLKSGIAVVLSPYRSPASCARYKEALKEALESRGDELSYVYADEWALDERVSRIQAEKLKDCMRENTSHEEPYVLFSAHSIPAAMSLECTGCNYKEEHQFLSERIALKAGLQNWSICYQSRSGNPREVWLAPDINERLRELSAKGTKEVLVVPVGFILDNAEVLYDLDIEARQTAEQLGIRFKRLPTLSSEPAFINYLAAFLAEAVSEDDKKAGFRSPFGECPIT